MERKAGQAPVQCLLVYWSHWSHWPRASTKWGPPNFTHLVFFAKKCSFWQGLLYYFFEFLHFIEAPWIFVCQASSVCKILAEMLRDFKKLNRFLGSPSSFWHRASWNLKKALNFAWPFMVLIFVTLGSLKIMLSYRLKVNEMSQSTMYRLHSISQVNRAKPWLIGSGIGQ